MGQLRFRFRVQADRAVGVVRVLHVDARVALPVLLEPVGLLLTAGSLIWSVASLWGAPNNYQKLAARYGYDYA